MTAPCRPVVPLLLFVTACAGAEGTTSGSGSASIGSASNPTSPATFGTGMTEGGT
jgi:hypothetical protein